MREIVILGAGYVGTALGEVLSRSEHNNVNYYDPDKGFTSVLTDAYAYIICVPTPLVEGTKKPDYSMVAAATRTVAEVMTDIPGMGSTLVIVESTVGVGTCTNLVDKILAESGKPYDLAFSPERVSPGEVGITNAAKIIAGKDLTARARVYDLYAEFFELHISPSMEVAEMAKLTENVQRDVNIALMNELNQIAERTYKIDFNHVLAACRTKWNFADYRPGLVGGHCIAVDPWYMIHNNHALLMRTAREVNEAMPEQVANSIMSQASAFTELFVLLGENYKPGVKDTRNAGVAQLYIELKKQSLMGNSPPVVRLRTRAAYDSFMAALEDYEVVVIIGVDEEEFSDIDGLRLFI